MSELNQDDLLNGGSKKEKVIDYDSATINEDDRRESEHAGYQIDRNVSREDVSCKKCTELKNGYCSWIGERIEYFKTAKRCVHYRNRYEITTINKDKPVEEQITLEQSMKMQGKKQSELPLSQEIELRAKRLRVKVEELEVIRDRTAHELEIATHDLEMANKFIQIYEKTTPRSDACNDTMSKEEQE